MDNADADLEPFHPTGEIISRLEAWWALNLEAAESVISVAGSIATEASQARYPFELWTMIPGFAASAATAYQSYVCRTMKVTKETQFELGVATAPLVADIERMFKKAMPIVGGF